MNSRKDLQCAGCLNAALQTGGVRSVTYHARMKDADKQQAVEDQDAREASALLQAANWKRDVSRKSGSAMVWSGKHVEPFNPLAFNREAAA